MMPQTKVYWLHALTPLHVGAGAGLGFIDLPVMREKATGWPMVPGSAVKGVLADSHDASAEKREGKPLMTAAFGTGGEDNANAGALVFTDARLVCLPVRSLYGTFAWVTCKLALDRLARDLKAAGKADVPATAPPSENALVAELSVLNGGKEKVYLGELDFRKEALSEATQWATFLKKALFPDDTDWQAEFQKRFVIVSEDSFNFFSETATEVNARIKMDSERRIVDKEHGALWYEESLPAETVLAGLVWCDRIPAARQGTEEQMMDLVKSVTLQIGGKATVGRGQVRLVAGAAHAAGAGGVR
jgi:CRISPR-associated protein Cmr4